MAEGWLVVALHGYGGTGQDFAAALADARPDDVPEPVWLAPDGGAAAAFAHRGHAWFNLTRRADATARHAEEVAASLAAGVADAQSRLGVGPGRTAAVGFSQGAPIASALLARGACAAAVAIAGHAPLPVVPARSPGGGAVLLAMAGLDDPTVPPALVRPDEALLASGVARFEEVAGVAHEATDAVLRRALAFVWDVVAGRAREEASHT